MQHGYFIGHDLARIGMTTTNENVGLNDAIDALDSLHNYRDWILDEFGAAIKGHTVEIGAGSGNISEKLLQIVSSIDAVEPSTELSDRLTARLGDRDNITIYNVSAEDWLDAVEPESCDTIIMVSVLEHIEDDVGALGKMHRALRPGGALLIFVPALMYLFSKLDHEHGHFCRYEKRELALKVEGAGFEIARNKYIDLIGIVPWLIFNKWMQKTEFDEGMVRLYDRFGIPLTRFIEKFSGSPLGKNVLLIGEKPAS